ncbi:MULTISPECIES: CopG family transcriptional regulator [Thermoprotei]|uniref:type II toxin-antitoxin system VapB family antitoxin n=1 Tax=Thermoprotei TaxID=183924 RepID=UPI00315EA658
MSVFSVKLRREIREKMDKYRDRVNWAEEVRRFIESRLRMLEAEENIKNIVKTLSQVPLESPRGSSVTSVREDRDSR